MAKRAARRAKLHAIDNDRIHSLVFDHTPANDRDQSYIRQRPSRIPSNTNDFGAGRTWKE